MKRTRFMLYVGMVLMVLTASCTFSTTPTATLPPATSAPATSAPVTSAPSTQAPSAPPASTATTAPLDLAGPPMQVGSTYLYFDGSLLVAVPGGTFLMGHGGSDNPEHTVTLGDFWIYTTKVTNRQFQQCVAVGKCTTPDLNDDQTYSDPLHQSDPVVGVNWAQSAAYCDYAHGTLPTEAQWEKTARGPNGNLYPWGNNAPADDLLNYFNHVGHTTNVIDYLKGRSYYDALDMEGNTYEWVYDWYDPLYYKSGPAQDPLGPDAGLGGNRSVRSAGYKSSGDQVSSSTRFYKLPTDHARDLGFRCVVKDPTFFAPLCKITSIVGPGLGGNPGSASGAPTPQTLNISVGYSGCGTNSIAVVSFNDTLNPDPNLNMTNPVPPVCVSVAPGSHVAQWTCTGAANVNMSSSCVYPAPLTASCPAHYNLTGGVCVWDGSGTAGQQCPAGTTYDPLGKCCTSIPGTALNFPACPAGTFFQDMGGGNYQCLPSANACSVAPASASVGDPVSIQGQCGSTIPTCPARSTWNPKLNCCTNVYGRCVK